MIGELTPRMQIATKKFLQSAENIGIDLRIVPTTGGRRTAELQNQLFAIGRGDDEGKHQKVTNAKGGDSPHNYGMAIDVVQVKDGKTIELGKSTDLTWVRWLANNAGLEWGGDWKKFKDAPHFQDTEGKSMPQVKQENASAVPPTAGQPSDR